jgi:hypothetical protein
VATALTACCLTACGGSDNKTLTYSGFATKANAFCNSVNKDVQDLSGKLTGTAKTDAAVYDDLIPVLEKATNGFKKLKPPPALQPDFDKFNTINERQLANAKKAQEAAKAGDQQSYIAAVQAVGADTAENNAEASKLGAADCISK